MGSCSSQEVLSQTQEYDLLDDSEEEAEQMQERIYRSEIQMYLALHGKTLFGLESSKWLAKQHKINQLKASQRPGSLTRTIR